MYKHIQLKQRKGKKSTILNPMIYNCYGWTSENFPRRNKHWNKGGGG